MASLFIKDARTKALAEKLAQRRGMTKTAAVRMALEHELQRDADLIPERAQPLRTIIEEFWRERETPQLTGLKADKAFFDSLYDD